MTTISQGGEIILSVNIYEYNGGPLYDPTSLSLDIKNPTDVIVESHTYPADIVRVSTGQYRYTFTAEVDAPIGEWTAEWTAVVHSASRLGIEEFNIVAPGEVDPGTGADATLGAPETVTFAGVIDPLYVDPEELQPIFPEAGYLEIAEAIWVASAWVKQILKVKDGEFPTNVIAYDYVKAAAACSLSGTYGNGFISGESNAESIALGDLRVEYAAAQPNQTGTSTRGTAKTWCELAEALRMDLLNSGVGFKAVVKGSRYVNPIPSRELVGFKSRSEVYWDETKPQGQLDDYSPSS